MIKLNNSLRIAVIDNCNFACLYCPREENMENEDDNDREDDDIKEERPDKENENEKFPHDGEKPVQEEVV